MSKDKISIVMPVLNEAAGLAETLQDLQKYRHCGHEIIVVDGGSQDNSIEIAQLFADTVLNSGTGRATQMNAGADVARHEILLFLHSDTKLPADADKLIVSALHSPENIWGRFSLKLTSRRLIYRLVETTINWRTAISGIATGDQAIFVTREIFERVACFDDIPLMEDVSLGKKLLKYSWPCCLPQTVLSSSRRWEEQGLVRTVLLMWRLRIAYFFGANPDLLVGRYYQTNNNS